MSDEDETKITSSEQPRVKDPKRVEAGKRLGAISKAAKEKKARERYNREREFEAAEGMNWTIPIGIGTGVVVVAGLCYVCCKRASTEPPVSRERRSVPQEPEPRGRVLDSFD